MKDSFVFYREWRNAMIGLLDAIRLEVFDAIAEYGISGSIPKLEPAAELAFRFIKARMDKDAERCHQISEKRKMAVKKRWNKDTDVSHEQPIQKITTNSNETLELFPSDPETVADPPPLTPKQQEKADKKKKFKYAEAVSLTRDEYAKLCEQYGESATKRMIELLDNYKVSKGKKYVSDYRAILNWVIDRYNEEIMKYGTERTESNNGSGSENNQRQPNGAGQADQGKNGAGEAQASKDYSERF